jgi:PhnB protein
MALLNPYLNFDGRTEEAFNFYKSVFGGEFITMQKMKDTPEGNKLPLSEQNRVMHVALPIGRGNILMGSDTMPSMGHKLSEGNNVHLSISADSEQEAEKIFKGLSAGGTITMPLAKTFWNAYFGMLTDKFGVQWMINFDYSQK